jgi:hypothetical protein
MQEGNLLNTEGKKINYLSQVRRRTKKGTIHPWVATATAWQLLRTIPNQNGTGMQLPSHRQSQSWYGTVVKSKI